MSLGLAHGSYSYVSGMHSLDDLEDLYLQMLGRAEVE